MVYKEWLRKVDIHLCQRLGMSHSDLPDKNYRDWHDWGISPEEAADMVLELEGYK